MLSLIQAKGIADIIDAAPEEIEFRTFDKIFSAGFTLYNSTLHIEYDVEKIYRKIPRYIDPPNSIILQLALSDLTLLKIGGSISFPWDDLNSKVNANSLELLEERNKELKILSSAYLNKMPTLREMGGKKDLYEKVKQMYEFFAPETEPQESWFDSASEIGRIITRKYDFSKYHNKWFLANTGKMPEFYRNPSVRLIFDIAKNWERYQTETHFYR